MTNRILLTNDDGIASPGLSAMLEALAPLSAVYVAAPERERSGAGCSITLAEEIASSPVDKPPASAAWAVTGTPADAVKLAVSQLLPEEVDLVVSGINRGPNVGVSVFYSGTVAAAIEAAVLGLPAVAVSLAYGDEMPYAEAARAVIPLLRAVLEKPLGRGYLVNINVPNRPGGQIGPPRLTRHSRSGYREFYRPVEPAGQEGREDHANPAPAARRWKIDGEFLLDGDDPERDAVALTAGCISVTPMEIDLTAYSFLSGERNWEFLLDGRERA